MRSSNYGEAEKGKQKLDKKTNDNQRQPNTLNEKNVLKDEDPLLILNELKFELETIGENYNEDGEIEKNDLLHTKTNLNFEKPIFGLETPEFRLDDKWDKKEKEKATCKSPNQSFKKPGNSKLNQNFIIAPTPDNNKNANFKEIVYEHDYKADADIKKDKRKEMKSYEEEKKLINLNFLKKNLFKKLKEKRKENIFRKKEKILLNNKNKDQDKKRKELNKPDDTLILLHKKKEEDAKKLNKQQLLKKRKRLERYLRIKKVKKQNKEKKKIHHNFLKTKTYLKMTEDKQFSDWKISLEEQIKSIFLTKNLNVNYITKTMVNNLEKTPFICQADEEEINEKLNKLELFDGTTYRDTMKKSSFVNSIQIRANNIENAKQNKEEVLAKMKVKLENLKNRGNYLEEYKKILQEATMTTTPAKFTIDNFPDGYRRQKQIEEIAPKLEAIDKLKVKQRIINFSMSIYDKVDLKKMLIYWRENMTNPDFLNRIKASKEVKNKHVEELKKNNKEIQENKDEKKKTKVEVHIKQSYAQPNIDMKKLIPFCNNIYTIQKNES